MKIKFTAGQLQQISSKIREKGGKQQLPFQDSLEASWLLTLTLLIHLSAMIQIKRFCLLLLFSTVFFFAFFTCFSQVLIQ